MRKVIVTDVNKLRVTRLVRVLPFKTYQGFILLDSKNYLFSISKINN